MDPASSERSRFRERWDGEEIHRRNGLAMVSEECQPSLHVWCSVLLFRHRPRPAEDPAFQCVQQLREAWAYKQPHRFLLFDRDAKFGAEVFSAVRDMGSEPTRTAFRSPWQNGVAER